MNRFLILVVFLFVFQLNAHAFLVDITDPSFQHFGDFPHVNSLGDYSNISKDFTIDGHGGDFGWHYSPSNHGSSIAGIILPHGYAVTEMRIESHVNPFKDFLFQGSLNTTTGFDGDWQHFYLQQ